MKVFYTDQFPLPLPEGHRFPKEEHTLLRRRLLESGIVPAKDLVSPELASDEQLLLVHDADYLRRVVDGQLSPAEVRRIGFPWSPYLVERSRRSVGASIAACRAAASDGLSVSLGGGTHHAHRDSGAGYCVFNDVAVAARTSQVEGLAQQVLIIDCDVHQGDGTATIFADDPSVFTFSIHSANNYPFHKAQSDLDVALPDGTQDEAYLEALSEGVRRSLSLARADLAIYLAGADPFKGDRLGRFALTKEGLACRDELVFDLCRGRGLPVAVVMGGSYARRIEDTVDIHLQTVRLAVCKAANSS